MYSGSRHQESLNGKYTVVVLPFVDKMEFDETVLIMDHNRVIFIESTARIVEHLVDTDNCLYPHAPPTL